MRTLLIVVLVVCASLVVGLVVALLRPRRRRVAAGGATARDTPRRRVLGAALADAMAADARHVGDGGPSPIPAGGYDPWREEFNLLRTARTALDDSLSAFCRDFAAAEPETRDRIRGRINLDGFYTLLTFSRRCAPLALASRDPAWIGAGLTAVAAVDMERIDFRDADGSLVLLHHAGTRLGADLGPLFRDAARLATREVAEMLSRFLHGPATRRTLRASLYEEVEAPGEVVFLRRDLEPYAPTIDLRRVALEVADVVRRDRYAVQDVTVATALPDVWLGGREEPTLADHLRAVVGGATVRAALRPEASDGHTDQLLLVFLVETTEAAHTQGLRRLTEKHAGRIGLCGVASGRLFCLVVGPSGVVGRPALESDQNLLRFGESLQEVLDAHSGSGY